VAKVAGLLGWELFPWQRYAVDVSLEYDEATRLPAYRTVGVSVARQNGKTMLVCVRIALQLMVPYSTVAYTAQDRNMARFKWAEHVERLMSTSFADRVRHVSRMNGSEALIMDNGSQYVIVTPKKEKAGRSMSIDLAVIDEAFAQRDMGLIGAIQPTMAAKPHAQLWVLSNAGTFESVLWRHYTDLGRSLVDNPMSSMCWLEWAADESADVFDHQGWLDANPSLDLPFGVTSAHLSDAALGDGDTFRREHMNLWVDLSQLTGIDAVTWAACRDDELRIGARVALSLDFTPERDRGALVACGDVDGRTPLEVLEHGSDLEHLVARTAEIATRWGGVVVMDRGGPAASAIPALERAGVTVRLIALPDFARACGDFHDAAVHARLAHRGDYRLSDAVAGATKRRVVDAWVWRRRGGADISPLVAATLARWGVVAGAEIPVPALY
jgi:phage terminase large subunit-like protein